MRSRILAPLGLTFLTLLALACGGSSNNGPPPPPPVVAPSITVQPQNQTVWSPTPATFTVQASGTAPLTYQWKRNGADIPSASQASFTIAATSVSDHGSTFSVVVSNSAGSATSTAAVLTVNERPVIMEQPNDLVTVEGQLASFSARAQGTPPLTYQWKRNGTAIPGANATTYTIPSVTRSDDQALFSAVVSNVLGSVETRQALLQVGAQMAPPVITEQPLGGSAYIGQSFTLSVKVLGTPPFRYQWRKNGVNIAGATLSTLAFTNVQATDAGNYSVVVANDAGSVTSTDAVVQVVIIAPTITTQPTDLWAGTGQSATFSVVAAGSPPIQYQWQRNGVDISGANQATYTTPPAVLADNLSLFKVRISNPGGSITSNEVKLQVFQARTVNGSAGTFWQNGGALYVPRNLQGVAVDALQLAGSGVWNAYPGNGGSDGSLQVAGLPPGPYLLRLGADSTHTPKALWVVNGDPDFRDADLGRTDRSYPLANLAFLNINIIGPLRGATQALQLYLPTLQILTDRLAGGPLYRYPWKGLPLPVAAKDTLWTLEPKPAAHPEGALNILASAASQTAPDMPNAGETAVDVQPAALTASASQGLAVASSAYVAQFPNTQPAIDPVTGRGPLRILFTAQPAGGALGPLGPRGPLFSLVRSQATDLPSTTVAYADPYPVTWQRVLQMRQEFSFTLTRPGGTQTITVTDAFEELWPMEQLPAAPLAPRVHAVVQPKLDSASLFTPASPSGLTPTVSWQIQSPDAPSYQKVTVYQVLFDTGSLVEKMEYRTGVPSQKITPGVLESGNYYLVRIQNVWGSGYDPSRPYMPFWQVCSAPVYSGILAP